MALNEQIVEETRYYRQCVDKDNKKWERYGLWNRGKDTECEDGNTVETKVGAIKGITTSTNVSETGYAADAKTVSEINQSLTNLKNPAKGTKGILVNGGAPLSRDFLLVYTLKTTNVALSGASFSINGIKVGDLVTRTPNSVIEISGCVRAFAGDVITTHVASAGGYADVYAYSPNTI